MSAKFLINVGSFIARINDPNNLKLEIFFNYSKRRKPSNSQHVKIIVCMYFILI